MRALHALFTLAFALAPRLKRLTSLAPVTRRIIMQKARSHAGLSPNIDTSMSTPALTPSRFPPSVRLNSHSAPTACKYMVSGSISLPSTGFFSFFSRPTSFTIGRQGILSLRRGSSWIHTGFHVSGATWVAVRKSRRFRIRDFHPLWRPLSIRLLLTSTLVTSCVLSTTHATTPTTPNTQRVEA